MATQTQQCPNCGSMMSPKFYGEMQDKILVCPSCGTTMDVADSFKRVKTVRREHKRGLFGNREIVEEQVHEVRDDPKAAQAGIGGFSMPGAASSQPPPHVQLGQPVVIQIPTAAAATTATLSSGCGCLLTLVILASIALPLFFVFRSANIIDLPFGLSNKIDTLNPTRQLKGHQYSVDSVAYSPDGTRVLSMGSDGLWLWDAQNGTPVTTISGSFSSGYVASFSPDGSLFAVAVNDQLELHDSRAGGLVRALPGRYYQVQFSPDGQYLAASYSSNPIKLLDATTGQVVREFPGEIYANQIAFSPDGTYLAAMGNSSLVAVWQVATGSQVFYDELKDGTTSFNAMAIAPDSRTIAFVSSEDLYFYRIDSNTLTRTGKHNVEVENDVNSYRAIVYSPDGNYIALGDFFSKVMVWNVQDKRFDFKLESDDGINALAFSPDSSTVVGGGYEEVYFWEISEPQPIQAVAASDDRPAVEPPLGLEVEPLRTIAGQDYSVDYVTFTPDGSRIISLTSGQLWVWDAATGAPLASIANVSAGTGVAVTPDSRAAIIPINDRIEYYDLNTGSLLQSLRPGKYYNRVVLSPDGNILAASRGTDSIELLNADTGGIVRSLPGELYARGLAFSADGTYFAAYDSATLGLWQVATGQQLFFDTLVDSDGNDLYIYGMAFTPDSQQLILAESDALYFYALHNGTLTLQETLKVRSPGSGSVSLQSMAISPDGRYLAFGNFFDGAYIWNIAKKGIDYVLKSDDEIESIAFSPDSSIVVGAGYRQIILWQFSTSTTPPVVSPGGGTVRTPTPPASNPTPTSLSAGSVATCLVAITSDTVRIRQGPGTEFAVQGRLEGGANVDGQTRGNDGFVWWHLADGRGWVREDVVSESPTCTGVPQRQP